MHILIMIAKPSIAFNDFSGTAKEVTARNVSGRNVLSVRAKQSKVVTPAQAVSRNKLSKISRAYKQLSDSQMAAWEVLAKHLKGESVFGVAAEMTGHNAFVRINGNRQLLSLPILNDAPDYRSDVSGVEFDDFWVTPERLVFVGFEYPDSNYRLVLKMSNAISNGVSSGWGNTVIISPSLVPDWGDVDAFQVFAERLGVELVEGKKYFIEMYWLDSSNGFVGEVSRLSAVCGTLSQREHQPYTERPSINNNMAEETSSLGDFNLQFSAGTPIMSANIEYVGESGVAAGGAVLTSCPDALIDTTSYVLARGNVSSDMQACYAPQTYRMEIYNYSSDITLRIAHMGGYYGRPCTVFGSGVLINRN